MFKKLFTIAILSYTSIAGFQIGDSIANDSFDETANIIEKFGYQTVTDGEKIEIKRKETIKEDVDKDRVSSSEESVTYNDYQSCNILDVAKKGDIMISEYAAVDGITGHALIVEKVENGKVIVIEAVGVGVIRDEMDCYRFYDRRTNLFSVKDATSTDIDGAVAWAQSKIGSRYSFFSTGCSDDKFHCAMLVHCAYNIGANKPLASGVIFPRDIRDSKMTISKEVYFHSYTFINKNSARCIDVPAFNTGRVQLKQWECNGAINQNFLKIKANGLGASNLVLAYNIDYTIEIDNPFLGNSQSNNNAVLSNRRYNSYKIQKFLIVDQGSGLISLRGENTDYQKCITVKGASTAQGAVLIQYQYNNSNNDKWTMVYSGISYSYIFRV